MNAWKEISKAYLLLISLTEIAYFLIKNKVDMGVMDVVLSDPKIEIVPNIADDVRFTLQHLNEISGYDDFNDFLILSVARRLKLPLLTCDKKLKQKTG